MTQIRELDATEIRVVGALLEKEQATPEYYPLTVNALINAANQKSNRSPVMALTETEIIEALEALRADVLVWRNDSARSERWSQSISRRLELDAEEKALLTLLLLRGPQTSGELRSRSSRLHEFDDLGRVEAALRRLAVEDRELVVELRRAPGQKEARWVQQLGGSIDISSPPPSAAVPAPAGPGRLALLEERVRRLEEAVEELRRLD